MKTGILEVLKRGIRLYTSLTSNYVGFAPPVTPPAANITFTVPGALPPTTQAFVSDASGNISFQALGGGGTVTNVGLTAPADFTAGAAVTTSGSLSFTRNSQAAALFLASPSGVAGVPTYRGIAWTDVSSLAGSNASSFALGSDARFHTQNTDIGTTSTAFQLNSGASGIKLKDVAGVLSLRNAADTAGADLVATNVTIQGNLTVAGTTTTINTTQVAIADNILTLNSDVTTGTPTENAGIEALRGASATTRVQWDETAKNWFAGTDGNLLPVARFASATFTTSSLVSGIYTFTHNLNSINAITQLKDASGKIIEADDQTAVGANVATFDLTSYVGFTGSYTAVAVG
jgi:hypothetical protein